MFIPNTLRPSLSTKKIYLAEKFAPSSSSSRSRGAYPVPVPLSALSRHTLVAADQPLLHLSVIPLVEYDLEICAVRGEKIAVDKILDCGDNRVVLGSFSPKKWQKWQIIKEKRSVWIEWRGLFGAFCFP